VATLRALDRLLKLHLPPLEIARLGQAAEVEHAGVACGIMDQMAATFADASHMLFLDTLTLNFELLPFPAGSELLVVDSGVPRELGASGYNVRRAECEEAARLLGVPSLRFAQETGDLERLGSPLRERVRHVISENRRVQAARKADAVELGSLMLASHASLRDDYQVSVPALDELVGCLEAQPEVFGARLTGAGFGGACVALVREGEAEAVGRRVCDRPASKPVRVVVPDPDRAGRS
jgi:galactokinase